MKNFVIYIDRSEGSWLHCFYSCEANVPYTRCAVQQASPRGV